MANNIRSGKSIADGLRGIANIALEQERTKHDNQSQQGMFGEQPTLTRQQILGKLGHGNNAKDQASDLLVNPGREDSQGSH